MGYFAFVRRDADRHYVATLPDFPGCLVRAGKVELLAEAIRSAVGSRMTEPGARPAPTPFDQLPQLDDQHDGYWLMVDLDATHAPG